jgi:hypothetical protein
MTRLTEYHNGVAVIKNKDFKAAAEKLAMFEDGMKRLEEFVVMNDEYISRSSDPLFKDNLHWQNSGVLTAIKILQGGGSDE